ncbi:peptidoglycan-binding protein [Candidatus Parcubacteria bacterium]|nr:peptidoglycan-binding protein [Candidatus Parcubacteria bacterium]
MLKINKVLGVAAILTMVLPVATFAQTNSQSITNLLTQIKNLQAQIAALQTQQQAIVSNLVTTLKQGSEGDNVKILQSILASDPSLYPEGLITGHFGPATARAVMKFQEKNGLEKVGNVGPRTLAKLNEFLREHPIAWETGTSTATSTRHREDGDEDNEGKRPCAIVPPGHLIAPGWLKKHDGDDKPVVPLCQKLPPGIWDKLEHGTTTPPQGTTTPPVNPPPSGDSVVISNVAVTSVATTTATISWLTNRLATGKVYFGTSTPLDITSSLTSSVADSTLRVSHLFTLTGLTGATNYYFVLESTDPSISKTATSTSIFFATTN